VKRADVSSTYLRHVHGVKQRTDGGAHAHHATGNQ
jgi:hypothetical protein